jgi:hypothetical protein
MAQARQAAAWGILLQISSVDNQGIEFRLTPITRSRSSHPVSPEFDPARKKRTPGKPGFRSIATRFFRD